MAKLYRQIDEVLLAIALVYQRPGVSAWKRGVARRYLRRRFRLSRNVQRSSACVSP